MSNLRGLSTVAILTSIFLIGCVVPEGGALEIPVSTAVAVSEQPETKPEVLVTEAPEATMEGEPGAEPAVATAVAKAVQETMVAMGVNATLTAIASEGTSQPEAVTQDTEAAETPTSPLIEPSPTPVVIANTPPDMVLKEGDTWIQNGLSLTAKDFCVLLCLPATLEVTFVLENLLDHAILLSEIEARSNDIFIVFDTGEEYTQGIYGSIPSQPLQPGARIEWQWDFWRGNKIGANARNFTIVVKRIGNRITNAKWQGEIPR